MTHDQYVHYEPCRVSLLLGVVLGRCFCTAPHSNLAFLPGGGGGATPRVLGRQLPLPPHPLGVSGQQLVAEGVALRCPWAPKAPDAP